MNKLTYKEFEEIMKELNCEVHWRDDHISIKPNTRDIITLATVNRNHVKVLDLDWGVFDDILTTKERIALADACWQLASTPPEERSEQYYYRVKAKYMHLFDYGEIYLNYDKERNIVLIDERLYNENWKSIFTKKECEELEKEFDLTILDRVGVKND